MDEETDDKKPNRIIPDLKEGALYDDYEDLLYAITKYGIEHHYVYTTIKSKTVTQRNKELRALNRALINDKLRMTNIKFGCKHYGLVRTKGRGIRPNQKSYKDGCPSCIDIVLSCNNTKLLVKNFTQEHNHETDAERAKQYPERRRLSKLETSEIEEHLTDVDIKPAELREFVRSTTNKLISYKDVYNLRKKFSVLPKKCLLEAKQEPVEEEEVPEYFEHTYADNNQSSEWEEQAMDLDSIEEEYGVPQFLDNEVVIESEDVYEYPAAVTIQTPLPLDKVNEAWKCVYMVLEEENKQLKRENERLLAENSKLKNIPCQKCSTSPIKIVSTPKILSMPKIISIPKIVGMPKIVNGTKFIVTPNVGSISSKMSTKPKIILRPASIRTLASCSKMESVGCPEEVYETYAPVGDHKTVLTLPAITSETPC